MISVIKYVSESQTEPEKHPILSKSDQYFWSYANGHTYMHAYRHPHIRSWLQYHRLWRYFSLTILWTWSLINLTVVKYVKMSIDQSQNTIISHNHLTCGNACESDLPCPTSVRFGVRVVTAISRWSDLADRTSFSPVGAESKLMTEAFKSSFICSLETLRATLKNEVINAQGNRAWKHDLKSVFIYVSN